MSVPNADRRSNGACFGMLATWRKFGLLSISSMPGIRSVAAAAAERSGVSALLGGAAATVAARSAVAEIPTSASRRDLCGASLSISRHPSHGGSQLSRPYLHYLGKHRCELSHTVAEPARGEPADAPSPATRPAGRYTGLVSDATLAAEMRAAAATLLTALDEPNRDLAARPFTDERGRRWIEYRPRPRPGACLADLDRTARKAAHRLLATGLSPHAYAQAATIMALEEVLDRREGWRRGRHSADYWITVFGDPARDDEWSWRFEGHHLSVTMTVAGDRVSPAPVFLGANPALVGYAGRPVTRPLAPEEDLARALLDALGPDGRAGAIVADRAPADIHSGTLARSPARIDPLGVPTGALGPTARALLDQLVALYLDRLPPELAAAEAARVRRHELHFAWAGPTRPGQRHYYRVQGDDLLIEYDNTSDDGNHVHTVLRRPRSDFGDDVLAAHRAAADHT